MDTTCLHCKSIINQGESIIRLGDIEIDTRLILVKKEGKVIDLTKTEYDLLLYFTTHPNTVLNNEVLLRDVWGYRPDTETHVVKTYISYLRKKLNNNLIRTRRNFGYILWTDSLT